MGTKIKIKYLTEKTELFRQYPGQSSPQGAFVELHCQNKTLTAHYNPEIGNAIPADCWHKTVLRWSIPILTAESANNLLDEISGYADKIIDGFNYKWNGHNWVGDHNDAAMDAIHSIDIACTEFQGATVQAWEADDWFQHVGSSEVAHDYGISPYTSDEEISKIAQEIRESEDVDLLLNLEDFLESVREEISERTDHVDL